MVRNFIRFELRFLEDPTGCRDALEGRTTKIQIEGNQDFRFRLVAKGVSATGPKFPLLAAQTSLSFTFPSDAEMVR